MEALVALGLASNVVQSTKEGATAEHRDLQHTADTISKLTGRIQDLYPHSLSRSSLTQGEIDLLELAKRCMSTAETLQSELLNLSTASKHGLRAAVKKTWSSMRRAGPIDELNEQLEKERRLLDTTLLASLYGLVRNAMSNDQQLLLQLADTEKAIASDLASGVQSVAELVKHQSERTRKAVRDEGLATRDFFSANLQDLKTSLTSQDLRQSLLDSLHFPEINLRQEQIKPAFAETFKFLFEDSTSHPRPWSNFVEWLRHDRHGDLYWIQGKAGSGKSTLMNLISEDSRTTENLFASARGDSQPILITFFFWNAGTVLQRTADGLIRSILYQLIDSDDNLYNRICAHSAINAQGKRRAFWSLKTLTSLLEHTVLHLQRHVCVLLDGLDEFDDEIQVLINIVDILREAHGVKMCISSRPMPGLERAFEQCNGLKLQDFTRDSIRTYVNSALCMSVEYRDFQARQAPWAESRRSLLIENILERAKGVFLWVTLVIREILEGIDAYDDWDMLLQRLDDVPEDIEKLYDRMWGRIRNQHKQYAMTSFRLILCGEMSLLEFMIATDPNLQRLYLEEDKCVSDEVLVAKCHERRIQLTARCGWFLEVASTTLDDDLVREHDPLSESCEQHSTTELTPYYQLRSQHQCSTVGFFHRTAADYVRWRLGVREIADARNDPLHLQESTDTRLRCRCVLWRIDPKAPEKIILGHEMHVLHMYGSHEPSAAAYNTARRIYEEIWKDVPKSRLAWPLVASIGAGFDGWILEGGYCPERLEDLVDLSVCSLEYKTYLLACACRSNWSHLHNTLPAVFSTERLAGLISRLLVAGARPMDRVEGQSHSETDGTTFLVPWYLFLHALWNYLTENLWDQVAHLGTAVEAFLRAGADAEIMLPFFISDEQIIRLDMYHGYYDEGAQPKYGSALISANAQSIITRLSQEGLLSDGFAKDSLTAKVNKHLDRFEVVAFKSDGEWYRVRSKSDSNAVLVYLAIAPLLPPRLEQPLLSEINQELDFGIPKSQSTPSEAKAEFHEVIKRSLHLTKETTYSDWEIPSWTVNAFWHLLVHAYVYMTFNEAHSCPKRLEDMLRLFMFDRPNRPTLTVESETSSESDALDSLSKQDKD